MKKVLIGVLAVVALLAVGLIATPALARNVQQPQTATTAENDFYHGYGMMGGVGLNDEVTLGRVATTLGITYDQLVERLSNGETIAQIAQAQNVALSNVVDTIVAPQSEIMDVLVKYGYLTQSQAQTALDNLKANVENALKVTGYGPTTGQNIPGTGYGCGSGGPGNNTAFRANYGMMNW